ncbi:MAG: zinc-dependent metalloprotease, partial [Pseudonocardiaceae bacterium]
MADLVNWRYAQSTAALLGKTGPRCSPTQAREAVAQLRELAAVAAGHVTEVTGLSSDIEAPVRVTDRHGWIEANAKGFRATIEPAMQRRSKPSPLGPLAGDLSSAAMGLQLGAALAFVSSRVLGQYEIFSKAPGQLLLVAPNVI